MKNSKYERSIIIVRFILLSIFYIINCVLYSQESIKISYNIKNGLPSNNVYSIKQDSKGFIWATTDKGVVRYDGLKFKLFTIDDGLASIDNFSMLIDSKDNIWLYSFKAISKIEPSGKIKTFGDTKSYFGQFLINSKDVLFYTFWDDQNNGPNKSPISINLISNDKIDRIRHDFITINFKENGYYYYYNDTLFHLHYDKDRVVIKNSTMLNGKNNKMEKNTNPLHPRIPIEGNSKHIDEFIQIDSSVSVVFSEQYFRFFKKGKLFPTRKYPNNLHKFTTGSIKIIDDELMVIFDVAIYKYNLKSDEWLLFSNMTKCTGILDDTEGNIWVSTLGEGIFKYPKMTKKNILNGAVLLSNEKKYKVTGYKDKSLWTANANNDLLDIFSKKYYFPQELKDLRFLEADSTNLYFGGSNAAFVNGIKVGNIGFKNITIDGSHMFLASTFGIHKLPIENRKNLITIKNIQDRKNSQRIYAVHHHDGIFYSGNQNGLYWGVPTKDELIPICLDDEVESVSVNGIKRSSDGLIWVATEGNGVYVLKDKQPVHHFDKELLDGNIHTLKIDEKDQVWISTRFGVNKIYSENGLYQVKKYTSFHGLPSDYVFDTYCYDDILYVATDEGLVKIDVHELDQMDFSLSPPTYILSGHLLGNRKERLSLDTTGVFSYDQNSISFEYTGISYRSNGNIKFEYRLLPTIPQWQTTTNDNITFNNLNPNQYTFEVRTINAIGIKSTTPATYTFIIKKHYTQELWFLILVWMATAGFIAFLVLQYFKNRRKKSLEKSKNERMIAELKLKSLQSQMNPHFIFNSLNAIQQFINTENKKTANDYLSRFARLMRLYLVGSDSQFITLEQELEVLRLYCNLEHLRFANKFNYSIEIEDNILLDQYFVPAMLLQPHVENAIRHGLIPDPKENNLLIISVKKIGTGVLCVIEDNGIGRKQSVERKSKFHLEQHRSLGNKISKERLEMIRSLKLGNITEEIIDLDDPGTNFKGTRVVIIISK